MSGPLLPVRPERQAAARSPLRAAAVADDSSDVTAAQQAQIAAQHAVFDFQLAENAELQREQEALQSLVMESLKNEDEIMKKWIALI